MSRRFLVAALAAWPVWSQLPRSDVLSDHDRPLVQAEIARLELLRTSGADKCAIDYQLARTWASVKQWPEAIEGLRAATESGVGLDPSRDGIFSELKEAREFVEILARVRKDTPLVSHSKVAFHVAEGDLVPESIAYDPAGGRFYLGSMRKGKVLRCSASGGCADFAAGLGVVLGLKVHQSRLWILNNSEGESALMSYDLSSGRLVAKYTVAGAGHAFNDLAIAPSGDIYLTDTPAGAAWRLTKGAAELAKLPGRFTAANGIALSPDGALLYVSTFPEGITVLDLKTGRASPIAKPENVCLATIDGLYFHRGALIAIQNGFLSPRVVRLALRRDLRGIERMEILERRNPAFDGVTTGVLAGNDFYYMANIQDEKKAGFDAITILKLRP